MNSTIRLLRIIGTPFEPNRRWALPEEDDGLYRFAFKNRVALLYLERLLSENRLDKHYSYFENLHFRAEETLETAKRASEVLEKADVPYVIFKTIRPFPATPNDVDIICLGEKDAYRRAVTSLITAGYFTFDKFAPMQIQFSDPRGLGITTWDKQGGIYYVDLYQAPAVDYFVYIDPLRLRRHVEEKNIRGFAAKVLKPEIELAAILMHSVFPERTFSLELFYTICYSLAGFNGKQINHFVCFSRENRIAYPVKTCLSLSAALHRAAFGDVPDGLKTALSSFGIERANETAGSKIWHGEAPYQFSPLIYLNTFLRKLGDPRAQSSLGCQLIHMVNPVFLIDVLTSVFHKVTRESYIQK